MPTLTDEIGDDPVLLALLKSTRVAGPAARPAGAHTRGAVVLNLNVPESLRQLGQ